jgi:uncharacterized protein involved in exopolysaccharide biosynthesis
MSAVETRDDSPQILGAFRFRDVLVHVFYNAKIIRNCILAGLVCGLLAAAVTKTEHTADSLLLVLNGPGDGADDLNPAAMLMGGVPKAVASDAEIVKSEPVLRDAVLKLGLDRTLGGPLSRLTPLPAGRDRIDVAVDKFRKGLKVTTETNSNLITVSYTAADRRSAVRALQAVVDAYAERRRQIYSGATPELQEQEVRRYKRQLDDLDARVKEAQTRFNVINIAQDVTFVTGRQDVIGQRLSQAEERAQALDGELAEARRRLNSTPQQVFDSREVTNGTPNDDARNLLLRLKQDRAHLIEQYSPNWPGLKEVDAKIAIAEAQVKTNVQDNFFTERKVRNPDADQLQTRVSTLTVERDGVTKQISELSRQKNEVQNRFDTVRLATGELTDLLRQREVIEKVYGALSLQQAQSKLRNDAVESRAASLRIVQPPSARGKGRSFAGVFLLGGLVLGIAAAVAAAIVSSVTRQVFITPTEAERALQAPVVSVTDDDNSDFLAPSSREEVTRLAALMIDASDGDFPLRFIQVASAGEQEEKAELAVALAQEFALGWNLATLVIDLDGYAYDMLTAGAAGHGKLNIGDVELVLVKTATPDLWAVTQPREVESLFTTPRLPLAQAEKILEELRRRFRRIVMIGPQDFDAYNSRRLYPLADGHLLMVRSEKTRAPVAKALRDAILSASGDILGCIYTHRRFYIPERVYRWAFN